MSITARHSTNSPATRRSLRTPAAAAASLDSASNAADLGRTRSCRSGTPMRALTRTSIAALTLLVLQFTGGPAQAHLTDPVHAEWTAGFVTSSEVRKVSPGDYFQTDTIIGKYQASVPFFGVKTAPRTYDFTFPPGFSLSTTSFGAGECAVDGTRVHCESGIDFIESTHEESLTIAGNAGELPDGLYQINMTSTISVQSLNAGEPPTTYTDTDSMAIEILHKLSADLATVAPSVMHTLQAGVPKELKLQVKNMGPDAAREVFFETTAHVGFGDTVSTNTSGCSSDDFGESVRCSWPILAPGESKTISVLLTPNVFPQRVDGEVFLDSSVNSYENDPDWNNNSWLISVPTRCTYYISPTAVVHSSAVISSSGCTFVGDGSTIGKKAVLGKGSAVYGTRIGDSAKLGAGAWHAGGRLDRVGSMGANSVLGAGTAFFGEVGDFAQIGSNVTADTASAWWVIAESRAVVGSDSRVQLEWYQSLRIFTGAIVPTNTTINEAYCLQNPTVCSVYTDSDAPL